MNEYYLFKSGEEFKPYVSGLDFTFNIENAASAFVTARKDISDTVGLAVWNLAVDHYNSDNFEKVYDELETPDAYLELLDKLVHLLRYCLANFVFFHHFPFLQIRISNSGITIPESESQKQAYRYQIDDAKEAMIKTAWASMNDVIVFLNEHATMWDAWAAETLYIPLDVVQYEGDYYKCIVTHTSTDVFDAGMFELLEKTAVYFWEWTESSQFAESRDVFFDNERDFSKFYNIENSAYFFNKISFIIKEILLDDIQTKYNALAELQKRMRLNRLLASDAMLIFRIKKAVAYAAMAESVLRFNGHELPQDIRKELLEMETLRRRSAKNERVPLKSLIAKPILEKADKFMTDLDVYLDTLNSIETLTVVDREETDLTGEKFVTA